MADIYLHPNAPKPVLSAYPPVTAQSVIAADHRLALSLPRLTTDDDEVTRTGEPDVPPPPPHASTNRGGFSRFTDDERAADQSSLSELIQKYGAARVMTMVRNLAHIAGQSLTNERPSHLCLADGAALKDSICVRCGRDNS